MSEAGAPSIDEIRVAIVTRMQELAPLVAECGRLEQAEAALEKAEARLDDPAPYGYKANGEPYKRRPPHMATRPDAAA